MSKGGRRVRIFSALEVANICGVVNQTAINWIRNGHLKAFTTPGGQYRIYAKDLAAFLDKRGMSASGEVLQVMMENANWNTFLIAVEQSTVNVLKAEFEDLFPEHNIILATDWFEIGRRITHDKPGFVLLDAEMPGVDIPKVTRAIKEDPFFGKPYIFLLTDSQTAAGASDGNAGLKGHSADMILNKPLDMSKLKSIMGGLEKQLYQAITA